MNKKDIFGFCEFLIDKECRDCLVFLWMLVLLEKSCSYRNKCGLI